MVVEEEAALLALLAGLVVAEELWPMLIRRVLPPEIHMLLLWVLLVQQVMLVLEALVGHQDLVVAAHPMQMLPEALVAALLVEVLEELYLLVLEDLVVLAGIQVVMLAVAVVAQGVTQALVALVKLHTTMVLLGRLVAARRVAAQVVLMFAL